MVMRNSLEGLVSQFLNHKHAIKIERWFSKNDMLFISFLINKKRFKIGFTNDLMKSSRSMGKYYDGQAEQNLYDRIDEIINDGADGTILTYRDIAAV